MKSDTLPSFWDGYRKLDESIRHKARKTYVVWLANPFHPSWGAFKQTTPKSHRIYLQLAFDLWHVQQKGIPNV